MTLYLWATWLWVGGHRFADELVWNAYRWRRWRLPWCSADVNVTKGTRTRCRQMAPKADRCPWSALERRTMVQNSLMLRHEIIYFFTEIFFNMLKICQSQFIQYCLNQKWINKPIRNLLVSSVSITRQRSILSKASKWFFRYLGSNELI